MKNSASGPKIRGVADAGCLQIGLGLLGGGSRVTVVTLPGRRLHDVAEQDQARLGRERIHHRGVRVRHQDHVGLVDRLPAGDGRPIEHEAVAEHILLDRGDVLRGVLPLAAWIGEAEVHIFHRMLGEHLHHLGNAAAAAGRRLSRHTCCSPSSVLIAARSGAGCGVQPAAAGGWARTARALMGRSLYSFPPRAGSGYLNMSRARLHPRRVRRCGCGSPPRPMR